MSLSVHLTLTANGSEIKGESTQTSLQREDTIECLTFDYSVVAGSEAFSGKASGHRNYEPIRVIKKIDKSTPLLWRALCQNEAIEATFRFYRPSPVGDGTIQHFYTVEISEARVVGIDFSSPYASPQAGANEPPVETVSFNFNNIVQTYEDGGIAHDDNFREQS